MKPPPQVLYSLQYIKSRMLQPEDVIYGIIELGSNLGFLALGIVMVLLEGGRAVLTNGSRLVRVRFASTAVGGKEKERLVILGSGWGGYNVARRVDQNLYEVTVVSPNSYFSFTPFLASTTVGTLEYRCATEPVRALKGVHFSQAWAEEIDFKNKRLKVESAVPAPTMTNAPNRDDVEVKIKGDKEFYNIEYDKLVIAVGCYSASLGIEGVAKYAHFLKDIKDARAIRSRLLEIFEIASGPGLSEPQKRDILQIRVVGGGPTGVEYAAELHDFVAKDVERMYPEIKGLINITLYDVAPGILMSFETSLREYAESKFKRSGVAVKGNSKITAVGPDWLELEGEGKVPYGLLVWSTGLSPNPLIDRLEVSKDEKTHSLHVTPQLQVLDSDSKPIEGVFAIGDNATPADGNKLPATAQVASQMATYLSKSLNATRDNTELAALPGFKWSNKGSMVFIGDQRAMVDRSKSSGIRAKFAGLAAYLVWKGFYVTSTLGWRNKLLVPMYWTLAFVFGRDVTRF